MKKTCFTLIELLIVIAIIGILVTLLLPSLAKARHVAISAVCMSNQAQIAKASSVYGSNNNNRLAPARGWIPSYTHAVSHWNYYISGANHGMLYPYLNTLDVYYCGGIVGEDTNMPARKSIKSPQVYLDFFGGQPTFEQLSSQMFGTNRVRSSFYYNPQQDGSRKSYEFAAEAPSKAILVTDLYRSNILSHRALGSKWNLIKFDHSGTTVRSEELYKFMYDSNVNKSNAVLRQAVDRVNLLLE